MISPKKDIFFKEFNKRTGKNLLNLVDVILSFIFNLIQIAYDSDIVWRWEMRVILWIKEILWTWYDFSDDFEFFPLLFHFVKFFFVDKFSCGNMWDLNEFFLIFFNVSFLKLVKSDFVTEYIRVTGKLFDRVPVSLSEIWVAKNLKKRKFWFKMFIRECNILNNLEDRRVFSKCYIFESDKLMIGIGDILCDFMRIDCMQGLI